MSRKKFRAVIRAGRSGGAFVELPFDAPKTFGTKGRVAVRATFDGEPYRGSIAPMGGRHVLGVLKSVRAAIGKGPGDTVQVVVEPDTEPRTVAVPEDLAAALRGNAKAKKAFEGLAFTYRKEYVRWIEGAKKAETRERRVKQAVEKLSSGEKL